MRRIFAVPALLLLVFATPSAAADGAWVFALQCKSCHGAKSTLMGPALAAVAGADIAGRKDFKYSPALVAKAGVWTDAALDAYLARPAGFAAGTRMTTAVPAADNRAALIAYMKTLK
jgi:cytochrome c